VKGAFVETRGNDGVAPIPDLPALVPERGFGPSRPLPARDIVTHSVLGRLHQQLFTSGNDTTPGLICSSHDRE
jgi:hypothetical protein